MALSSRTVDAAKPGKYADGKVAGLTLVVEASGARRWVLRFQWQGKAREMGLGRAEGGNLADARERASKARALIAKGVDPIEEAAAAKIKKNVVTFRHSADALIASKSSEWRNMKHKAQWVMTLGVYAAPLHAIPVAEIKTNDVLATLQPLWSKTPETAARLRGRIEAVLDYARAKGDIGRNEANPARWRGHLDKLLARRTKLSRGHHAAMAFEAVPEFMGRLREREAMAALALEFAILTAARSGEALGARWAEIDLAAKVWTVPASRMKAGNEHRVPLSKAALAVLDKAKAGAVNEYVFPGQAKGKPLSGMAMEMLLRRLDVNVTVHGFRSGFRDWCGEATAFPREVAEAALAHVVGNKVEAAYRRGDALAKRRQLMEAWAGFCEPKAGNVLAFKKGGAG